LLTEHKTFGEEVKSITASWLKDYVDAMSKLLVPTTGAEGGQSSSGFAQFFQGFFGSQSGASNSGQAIATQQTPSGTLLGSAATRRT
jgi:hypothetical protein